MSRVIDECRPDPTDIALCGSMAHKILWLPVIDELRQKGYTVSTPELSETHDWSTFSDTEIVHEKGRLVRRHIANIATARCVLVANFDKNGIKNYIGSNSFLEMTVAFVLEKPIYLLNPVPRQDNYEELLALEPIVLDGDLSKIEVIK